MAAAPLVLILASAMLHALWNLVVKASDDRLVAAWAQVTFGALVFSPFLLVAGIPRSVWPAVVASSIVHLAYGLSLVAGYDRGDLSLVYPVARGVAPVIVTVAAVLLLDDVPSVGGAVAIAFVVGGVLWVAAGNASDRSGLGWAVVTGGFIATYTLIDAAAVRSLDGAFAYVAAVFFGNAIAYLPAIALRRQWAQIRLAVGAEWKRHLLAGALAALAYALVLAAARLAPLGVVAAFRETSVLFGALGGWLVLGERDAKSRVGGAALIAAALAVLTLAG